MLRPNDLTNFHDTISLYEEISLYEIMIIRFDYMLDYSFDYRSDYICTAKKPGMWIEVSDVGAVHGMMGRNETMEAFAVGDPPTNAFQ